MPKKRKRATKKRKTRYVILAGSKQLAWTKSKSKKTVNAVLAKEFRKKHKVSVGKLR